MNEEKLVVWTTKYALTTGIEKLEGDITESFRTGQAESYQYYHGDEWHITEELALEQVDKMRKKKISLLKKQLAKLELIEEQTPELHKVSEFRNGWLYARRTIVGGLEYVSDDIGGGQTIVDMTTVSIDALKLIVENHEVWDQVLPNDIKELTPIQSDD